MVSSHTDHSSSPSHDSHGHHDFLRKNAFDPERVTYFAETDSRNKKIKFGIKAKDRTRHVYVIGKTGMGKSTCLENMAVQDIQNGEGMAFIDPHGKTADLFLEYVPKERMKDVLYFAPFDMEYPVSFNVMEDVGPDKRHLVSNGLMSAFKKIWVDAWSARMEYILNNILLALLEYPDSTLIGVNRMLADKDYRNAVVANVTDTSVKAFWRDEFAKYSDKFMTEAGAAIQNKIGQFISNPLVRNIIGQPKSTFDLRKMMDERKIIIINLSKGRVGESNANLIGSMLITKIYLAAMSRADVPESVLNTLPNFYLYVDEFQSFANESFADILSEARKYKLNLTMAHQYIEQMSEEVRAAVFGNVGSMLVFRVGAFDAEVLEKEFAPQFTAEDLVNLGFAQIYIKLMINGVTSSPFSATTLPPIAKPLRSLREEIIESSRNTFARPRSVVEEEIRRWHEPVGRPQQKEVAPPEQRPVTTSPRPSQPPLRPEFASASRPSQPAHAPAPKMSEAPKAPPRLSAPEHNPTMAKQVERETELRKAMSLAYLKPVAPKPQKKPNDQNLKDLRNLLATLQKENPTASKEEKRVENVPPRAEQKPAFSEATQHKREPGEIHSHSTPPAPSKPEKKIPKEVPEDVLRKLLHVKPPENNA
ncbi:MAG: type IV secretion system DNA-binding domain-containing protein [Candidatus Pacebacteria bacterium]|nr:type IV secretion system DNA-binding domain-containing protein [Candidatus Paceibacterota bacterium]